MTEAERLLTELIELLDCTVGRGHGQAVEIITQNDEIAESLCSRYNAARLYVLKLKGIDVPTNSVEYEAIEPEEPDAL